MNVLDIRLSLSISLRWSDSGLMPGNDRDGQNLSSLNYSVACNIQCWYSGASLLFFIALVEEKRTSHRCASAGSEKRLKPFPRRNGEAGEEGGKASELISFAQLQTKSNRMRDLVLFGQGKFRDILSLGLLLVSL